MKKLAHYLLAFFSMTNFAIALIWLMLWCGAWDIQAVSQSEAFTNYPFALIPFVIGGISFYGACKLEN